jgi:hypothetical protein
LFPDLCRRIACSSHDPSQRTKAHNAWKPSLGDSSNPVKLSEVSSMDIERFFNKIKHFRAVARRHAIRKTRRKLSRHRQTRLGTHLDALPEPVI